MSGLGIYPRFAMARLEEALADTPVVLIHGPRQCGKSTLAQTVARKHGYRYLTLDDDNVLRAAQTDPVGFCAELPERAVLDEVQRVPQLFTSIKGLVDRDRRPG
ncbi:MAG: AAA family ATPase, partial [Opitutaceae bacterium]